MLEPKTVSMFYITGPKQTTPKCPVTLKPDLNPSSGIQSYDQSTKSCDKPATYNIPFFPEKMGPKSEEWTVSAHEMIPGHHLQVGLQYQYQNQ